MIESWSLCNFKSVVDDTKLQFGQLTLFTGANSAGKSTIIQSILLTAQTVQSSVYSRPVVLNGHIARLGSYKDLVSAGNLASAIEIGFTLSNLNEHQYQSRDVNLVRRRGLVAPENRPISTTCRFKFSVKEASKDGGLELALLQPQLEQCQLSVEYIANNKSAKTELLISRANTSPEERLKHYSVSPEGAVGIDVETLKYEVQIKPQITSFPGRFRRLAKDVVGSSFNHFLPRLFSVRYDQTELRVNRQFEALVDPYSQRDPSSIGDADATLSPKAVELLLEVFRTNGWLQKELELNPADAKIAKAFQDNVNQLESSRDLRHLGRLLRLMPRQMHQMIGVLSERQSELIKALKGDQAAQYVVSNQSLPDSIQNGSAVVQEAFGRLIKYLGPLRDEPKPVYPLSGGSDPADVGFRGEHTAAVLDLHKSTLIDYVPTKCFREEEDGLYQNESSLASAVLDWLVYMGVGVNFTTSDLGKLGHELKIATADNSLHHDLTQVGVGVSQVLPILVMALLAEKGSTLVFEQPELHLHPRVQSRLGDFFVSMTALKKQCIIETHSEYLLNRLRYRAAASADDSVAKSVKTYFVEKVGSKSIYRPVEINELGMIHNWPAGFFDEAEAGTSALLRKGLEKRKKIKKG